MSLAQDDDLDPIERCIVYAVYEGTRKKEYVTDDEILVDGPLRQTLDIGSQDDPKGRKGRTIGDYIAQLVSKNYLECSKPTKKDRKPSYKPSKKGEEYGRKLGRGNLRKGP